MSTTTSAPVLRSPTLKEFRETWRKLTAMPIMVAVWCVDRPDAFERMRTLLHESAPPARSFASECPVYEWRSSYADAEDWARRPECFHTPGVYMQMSTGGYIRVDI